MYESAGQRQPPAIIWKVLLINSLHINSCCKCYQPICWVWGRFLEGSLPECLDWFCSFGKTVLVATEKFDLSGQSSQEVRGCLVCWPNDAPALPLLRFWLVVFFLTGEFEEWVNLLFEACSTADCARALVAFGGCYAATPPHPPAPPPPSTQNPTSSSGQLCCRLVTSRLVPCPEVCIMEHIKHIHFQACSSETTDHPSPRGQGYFDPSFDKYGGFYTSVSLSLQGVPPAREVL